MANLDAEIRGGKTIWPWVIGLAVLALLIWGITQLIDPGAAATEPDRATDTGAVIRPPMAAPASDEPPASEPATP